VSGLNKLGSFDIWKIPASEGCPACPFERNLICLADGHVKAVRDEPPPENCPLRAKAMLVMLDVE